MVQTGIALTWLIHVVTASAKLMSEAYANAILCRFCGPDNVALLHIYALTMHVIIICMEQHTHKLTEGLTVYHLRTLAEIQVVKFSLNLKEEVLLVASHNQCGLVQCPSPQQRATPSN